MRLQRPLVEQRTLRHMCLVRDNSNKKANGENIVRIVLLAVAFFVLVQISTKEEVEESTTKVKIKSEFL
tara:strand:- start:106 stop:312 length:207 start_codon:yes stop_codon:yes gene_type:complete